MTPSPPLTGIRILDLSRLIPGAFATLMLAEMGAEVIKVEDPVGGDPTRDLPPMLDGRGLYHLLLNRGKKSVALDLRLPESRVTLGRLLDHADVMIESFRPKTARAIGIAGDQTRAGRPRLIHCSITGYGQVGPYADRPGHDLNYVAESGLLAADRPKATDLPRMFIADVGGGAMSAVAAILAALFARERTGEGAALDISMHDAMVYWMMLPAARELVNLGGDGARAEGDLPTFGDHACYNIYEARDGQRLALGALEPKFWRAFCDAIGRPELAARHRSSMADPSSMADQAALIEEVRAIFRTRTRDEWLAFFDRDAVCLSPANQPAEVLADPHVIARGLIVAGESGVRAIRSPFVLTPVPLCPAPEIGADTDSVFEALHIAR